MKSVMKAVLLLLCLSLFCACNKGNGGEELPGGAANPLLGCWAWNSDVVAQYHEIKDDGYIYYYQTSPFAFARFENGVLYLPAGSSWVFRIKIAYELNGNTLSTGGILSNGIVVTEDQLIQNGEVVWRRIKQFQNE